MGAKCRETKRNKNLYGYTQVADRERESEENDAGVLGNSISNTGLYLNAEVPHLTTSMWPPLVSYFHAYFPSVLIECFQILSYQWNPNTFSFLPLFHVSE